MPKLPYYLTENGGRPPSVKQIQAVNATVDDHLGLSDIMIITWHNGEGITIEVERREDSLKQRIDISWQEFGAIKKCVKCLTNSSGLNKKVTLESRT